MSCYKAVVLREFVVMPGGALRKTIEAAVDRVNIYRNTGGYVVVETDASHGEHAYVLLYEFGPSFVEYLVGAVLK